jgi:hypothetical protein
MSRPEHVVEGSRGGGRVEPDAVAAVLGIPDAARGWLSDLAGLDPEPAQLPDQAELPLICHRLGIHGGDQREILSAFAETQRPEVRWLLNRCRHLLVSSMGRPEPLARWPELQDRLGRYFYAFVYLTTLEDVRRFHQSRGVSDDVSWATLADLGRQMALHRQIRGVGGVHARPWLTRHFRGVIYRLGRLQFNMFPFRGAVHSSPLQDGEWVLGVHIPETGPLTPTACDDSIRRAAEFFALHFPEHQWRHAICTSWLLDRQLVEYLPPDSNIIRFGQRFSLVGDPIAGDEAVLEFVFHREGDVRLADLPQRTSLERAVVDHLRSGRHWRVWTGYLHL